MCRHQAIESIGLAAENQPNEWHPFNVAGKRNNQDGLVHDGLVHDGSVHDGSVQDGSIERSTFNIHPNNEYITC